MAPTSLIISFLTAYFPWTYIKVSVQLLSAIHTVKISKVLVDVKKVENRLSKVIEGNLVFYTKI